MAQKHSIVTVAGRNKEAAKMAANEALVLSHIALGSGDRFPSGGETELQNEVHRGAITGSGPEAGQPNAVWFDLYVPANVDTFYAQEIALFDEDGLLFALSRFAEPVPKFGPDSSSLSDNTYRIIVIFSDTENVVVTLSPVAGVTSENLPQHLPWADDDEALNADVTNKAIDPKRMHLALAGFAEGLDQYGYLSKTQDDASVGEIKSKRHNVSANMTYAGFIADILSNNADDMTANRWVRGAEHQVKVKAPANAERNVDDRRFVVYGARALAEALPSVGDFQDVVGSYNVVTSHTDSDVHSLWGSYSAAHISDLVTAGYVENIRGSTSHVEISGAATVKYAYGDVIEVFLEANNPNIEHAAGQYTYMRQNSGVVENAYALFQRFEGDWGAAPRFGVFQAGVTDNVFSGNMKLNGHAVWHDGRYFESGELEFNVSWFLAIAHPLGSRPKITQAWLKCLTADLGYNPGDMLPIAVGDSGDAGGITVRATDTHLYCQLSNHGIRIRRPDNPVGDDGPINPTHWRLIFGVFS